MLPSEPLATAVGYYQRHGDALFRFLDDPDVPIDNSPTEREFQNLAKLRLNMLFAGSTEGAHRACMLGIVATSAGSPQARAAIGSALLRSESPRIPIAYIAYDARRRLLLSTSPIASK